MTGRFTRADALAALVIAVLSGALLALPLFDIARGLSLDILTATRWYAFGPRGDPQAKPVVVVAIDEQTYQTPPFKGSPTLTWTREIGRVLSAILDGGARVVGFDIVFPTSIEQSEIPFGDDLLGARMRGFDRDFLRALAAGAGSGRLVLGEIVQHGEVISPAPAQRIAVRQQRNIRPLNVQVDGDDVVRRLPLSFASAAGRTPSMAVELAARSLASPPVFAADGSLSLAGARIGGRVPNTLTLNFDGGGDDIPTYSLADLRACADKGDADYFRRQFDGKVVLFGTLLDIEDRKLTSKRFATGIEGAHAPRCALPQAASPDRYKRSTLAGVYVHATAVDNMLTGGTVTELGRWSATLLAIGFALVVAGLALALSPLAAAAAYLGLVAALVAAATAGFARALALPLGEPVIAGFVTLVTMVGYRFVVVDRTERFLRASFGLYLAPQVIERMVSSKTLPKLGGEMRDVTVFFSDVAGFSTIAEQLTPDALVELMNEYLSAMTDIIECCGGYVDKYIGDSIVAVFGAPIDDPDHARNAVRAALLCRDRLEQLNGTAPAFRGHKLGHRIGLNSGEALVGNIGSRRRFNYTVMSDTVNLASRLEGANKYFDTSILAAETTVALTHGAFDWREVEAIRVKGRVHPVRIYEPLGEAGQVPARQAEIAVVYAEGLTHWRAREFAAAAAAFGRIAADDPPAALFVARAERYARTPPGPDWAPVHALEGK